MTCSNPCRGANANVTITPTKGKTALWTSPKIVESYEPLRIPKVSFRTSLRSDPSETNKGKLLENT